jgi:hypothetical protein
MDPPLAKPVPGSPHPMKTVHLETGAYSHTIPCDGQGPLVTGIRFRKLRGAARPHFLPPLPEGEGFSSKVTHISACVRP